MTELQKHGLMHDVTTSYSCEFCPYKSISKKGYMTHRSRHLKKPSHACAQCGKAFFAKSDLQVCYLFDPVPSEQ